MNTVKPKVHLNEFNQVIDRVKQSLGLRDDVEVARLMGLTATAFAERKRRNSVPLDKLALLCERKSINMNYILSGREEGDIATSWETGLMVGPGGGPSQGECVAYSLSKALIMFDEIMGSNSERVKAALWSTLVVLHHAIKAEEENNALKKKTDYAETQINKLQKQVETLMDSLHPPDHSAGGTKRH